ncbi:plasmid pRiA4b ORF-3 family protein [Sunxiuqinia sp. sy24]|uniref:plasmid pRiA4b ORF-3 family protein n=1 Tax=Sunxiuqinia sp. sy24 TaxID=3461495 RepID=UPI00404660BA
MAQKKKGKVVQMLSPEKYIRQRARNLPVHECFISQGWEEEKKVSIVISRKHTNGNFTVGFYLVDLLCLGVKDAHFKFNIPVYEYKELLEYMHESIELQAVDYTLAHNVIFAALEFADDYGFKPCKDFSSTMQYFLREDNDAVELIEIECGYQGQPMYVRGPFDRDEEANRILAQLEKTAGPGNFKFIDEAGDLFGEDDGNEDELREMLQQSSLGLQFKVQIENISKPPVWRRIVVPSHYTFGFFHMLIQDCFGWEDMHLYQFNSGSYGTYPLIKEGDEFDDPGTTMEADETRLSDIFTEEGQRISYLYDFGDGWKHRIVLEKILTKKISTPECIDGKGKCPPEDCGGPLGYENLKQILADPKHPEHAEMREWLYLDDDEIWDSKEVDLDGVRELLKSVFSIDRMWEEERLPDARGF